MSIPQDRNDGESEAEEYRDMETVRIRKIPFKNNGEEEDKQDTVPEEEDVGSAENVREVKPAESKMKRSHLKMKNRPRSATPTQNTPVQSAEANTSVAGAETSHSETDKEPAEATEKTAASSGEQPPSTVVPPKKPGKIQLKKAGKSKKTAPESQETRQTLPAEKAAPEPQSPQPSGQEEPAPAKPEERPGKPRLQQKKTQLPAHLQAPPESGNDKQHKKKASHRRPPAPTGQKEERTSRRLAPVAALVLIVAGYALTGMPGWTSWVNNGIVPTSQLVGLGILAGIMALLILTRRLPLRIIAAVFTLLLVGMCLLSMTLPLFDQVIAHEEIGELLGGLPAFELMGSAAVILTGAFILLTGGTVVQWVLAALCVILGGVMPWLPITESIPPLQPEGVLQGAMEVRVPAAWQSVETQEANVAKYTLPNENLDLVVRRRAPTEEMSLAEQTDDVLEELKQAYPDSGYYRDEKEDNSAQQRIQLYGEERLDVLIMSRADYHYEIRITGPGAAIRNHEALIDRTFAAF